jgi:nitronate monooxygenase
MREMAAKQNDIRGIQAWAGQSGGLTRADPAGDIVRRMWEDAQALLG